MKKVKNPDIMPAGKHEDEIDDYKINDAVRTLEEAEGIKKNEKLMPHVHKRIAQKHRSLGDLKKLAAKKSLEEQDAHEKTESAKMEKAEGE